MSFNRKNFSLLFSIALFSYLIFKLTTVVTLDWSGASNRAVKPHDGITIPTTGFTADGKYEVYILKELYNGYFSSGNNLFRPTDLQYRMKRISKQDADSGKYHCAIICKNREGQIVGLNPYGPF